MPRRLLLLLGCLCLPVLAWSQRSPAQIYQQANPAVVLLISHNAGNPQQRARGTGSVVAPNLILTNAHVVLDAERPFERIWVFLSQENQNDDLAQNFRDGRKAEVLHLDADLDLALLRVKDLPSDIQPLLFGDSAQVQIGDDVLAIGHPENGGLWSLTSGRIGARIRNSEGVRGKHVFQTEASLNRGNSGGPLLNMLGELVGVNTSIARQASDGLAITGVNFAVQAQVVQTWAAQLGVQLPDAAPAVASSVSSLQPAPAPELKNTSRPAQANQPAPAAPASVPEPELKDTSRSAQANQPAPKPPVTAEPQLLTPPRPFSETQLFKHVLEQEFADFQQQQQSEFEAWQRSQ
jgi:serine protease Do